MTTCDRPLRARRGAADREAQAALRHRYLPPLFITCILLGGPASRSAFSRASSEDGLAIADGDPRRDRPGRTRHRQVAAPGQRLHHRHQRRHPGPLARVLALRALQRHLDHLEVRAAR